MKPKFLDRIRLFTVRAWLGLLNVVLVVFRKILFPRTLLSPRNILVYKLGNIGDVVCAMPALRAIREHFPQSRITLLTSPGKRGAVGAKDFLDGTSYLDDIMVYYSDDIATLKKIFSMVSKLRSKKYDTFIQLPDDWARFGTMLRNEVFAKAIGVKSATGFYLRTSALFKKAQVDFTYKDNEPTALLKILKEGGIDHSEIIFEFPEYEPLSDSDRSKIEALKRKNDIVLGVCMGGKTEDKRWPTEKFAAALRSLKTKHTIGVLFFGGASEADSIERVAQASGVPYINFAGRPIKESIMAVRCADAFLTNDTGPMHIAAAFGIPIVALFSIRSVLGSWFPYGGNNICLYKKFLPCNYKDASCAKRGMAAITIEEVIGACEQMLRSIQPLYEQ